MSANSSVAAFTGEGRYFDRTRLGEFGAMIVETMDLSFSEIMQ